MDYRTDFSKFLVEERIEKLEQIALTHPDLKPKALRVRDSLKARLQRGAVIKWEE